MECPDNEVENALERFRPVLVTLAEAMISPAYRGNIEASDLVDELSQIHLRKCH
jgi:hypothetical protein